MKYRRLYTWIACVALASALAWLLVIRVAATHALDWAVENGHHRLLRLFVAAGGPLEQCSEGRGSPAALAIYHDDVESIEILLRGGMDVDWTRSGCQDESLLCEAASGGHLQVALKLMDAGANLNAVSDPWGTAETPYMLALAKGHTQIAELLKARGAYLGTDTFGGDLPVVRAPVPPR